MFLDLSPRALLAFGLAPLAVSTSACSTGQIDSSFIPARAELLDSFGGELATAQSITPTLTGGILQVDLWLSSGSSDTSATVVVDLVTLDEDSRPVEAPVLASTTVFGDVIADGWVEADFRGKGGKALAGQTIGIMLSSPSATDSAYAAVGDTFDAGGRSYEDGARCTSSLERVDEGGDAGDTGDSFEQERVWTACGLSGDLGFRLWVDAD